VTFQLGAGCRCVRRRLAGGFCVNSPSRKKLLDTCGNCDQPLIQFVALFIILFSTVHDTF
jgi:hypothetical protein